MLEIRPASLSEFALLPAIEAEADGAFATLDPAINSVDFPPPGSAAEFASAFHIMVAGRPPAAFVRLEIVDGQAHLERLAVGSGHDRQGIGRALVLAAQAWAREAGFRTMTLCTFFGTPFNAPFYAGCGFVGLPEPCIGPELAALREMEAQPGLDALGPRTAMKTPLGSP